AGPFEAWSAMGKVRRLLRDVGDDVVHAFGSWDGSVAQLTAPPDVAVVRTYTHPPNHQSHVRVPMLRYLDRRARSHFATRFLVPNEGSRGLAVRAYGALEGHVTVLPRSIDVAEVRDRVRRQGRREARRLMGIGEDEIAYVLTTEFESAARMDEVLTGFALATRERPDLRMFFVGSGRHEGCTRWKAEELQLGDSVIFLGRGTDSGPIWAAADVAIDATPWSYWSRAALIAIAAGLPTVKRQD